MIKKFLGHELISGASFIFLGSLFGNLLNFLFNLFMTRNLTVSDYGTLASMISLMTLSTIPAGAALPTVVRFAGSYFAKGDVVMVKGLYFKITKPFLLFGSILFVVLLLFRPVIGKFFNIEDTSLIILVALIVVIAYLGVANQPLLQAKLAFRLSAFLAILGAVLKLALGVLLVFLGLKVAGAMWGVLLSVLVPYFLSFIPLRFLLHRGIHTPHISTRELFSYAIPATLASFSTIALVSTDIILVKHFFDAQSAGVYAGLSLIGRIIFFLSAPIATVMFPLVVQKHTKEENFHGIFWLALLLVFISSVALTLFYFFFPEFTITFFTKKDYTSVSGLLGFFAIFITFYSLVSVITNFYLSVKRTEVALPVAFGALSQAILLWFYHESFLQVIIVSLTVTSLLLFTLLLYYWKLYGNGKRRKT